MYTNINMTNTKVVTMQAVHSVHGSAWTLLFINILVFVREINTLYLLEKGVLVRCVLVACLSCQMSTVCYVVDCIVYLSLLTNYLLKEFVERRCPFLYFGKDTVRFRGNRSRMFN